MFCFSVSGIKCFSFLILFVSLFVSSKSASDPGCTFLLTKKAHRIDLRLLNHNSKTCADYLRSGNAAVSDIAL